MRRGGQPGHSETGAQFLGRDLLAGRTGRRQSDSRRRVPTDLEHRVQVESFDCEGFLGSDLFAGKQLLVFANRGQRSFQKNTYSTNICTLTGPPERYGNTLKILGEGRLPN